MHCVERVWCAVFVIAFVFVFDSCVCVRGAMTMSCECECGVEEVEGAKRKAQSAKQRVCGVIVVCCLLFVVCGSKQKECACPDSNWGFHSHNVRY